MTEINSYLTISGNCREAMTFYKACLFGELTFQTVGESRLSEKMPKKMIDCILHSALTKDNLVLMGSDMVGEIELIKGNAVSLSLNCNSDEEIKYYYANLSMDGKANHRLEHTFW